MKRFDGSVDSEGEGWKKRRGKDGIKKHFISTAFFFKKGA